MTLLIVALPFLWDRKSSSFLFSEHIFNPWNTFFLLNTICLTAYKTESFAIGIPKQININIEYCHSTKMILCNLQELFHLCSDTMNEQLLQHRQWSAILSVKTKTCQVRAFLLCWAIQPMETLKNADLYNSIEKNNCYPFAVVLFTDMSLCFYQFVSSRKKGCSNFHAN